MKREEKEINLDIHTLGYYIDRALCVLIKSLNRELKEYKIHFHHSDFTILRVLYDTGGLSQSDLARILGKERSGIGRSLNSLEKEGYVLKKMVNGCTKEVFLSEKGIQIIPLLNEIADKVSAKAFKGFSEKKKEEMMRNLTLVYKNSL